MRLPLILGWLLLPVLAGAYHYGPGQRRVELDKASSLLGRAKTDISNEAWQDAIEKFDQALALIPSEQVTEIRRIRLPWLPGWLFDQLRSLTEFGGQFIEP